MLKHWLGTARAEFVREVTTALRYPLEVATGVLLMFALFQGIFTGARAMAGGVLAGSLEGVQIGYCMWFLAIITINSLSVDLESEARQGTLEQIFIHTSSFTGLMWVRGIVHVVLGAGPVVVLALLMQAATGHWIHVPAQVALPVLLSMALTVLGLCGWGLTLGGLALVYKRIGQMAAIVQFGLFLLAFSATTETTGALLALIRHGPFTSGIWLVNHMLKTGFPDWSALAVLALESVVYAFLGTMAFDGLKRAALRGGMLSHY
jgi:ABC-2 type transport system permease protein